MGFLTNSKFRAMDKRQEKLLEITLLQVGPLFAVDYL